MFFVYVCACYVSVCVRACANGSRKKKHSILRGETKKVSAVFLVFFDFLHRF